MDLALFLASLALSIIASNGILNLASLVCIVPMLFLVRRLGPGFSVAAGALHGALLYAAGCSWLGNYHAAALLFVIGLESFWFAIAWGLIAVALRSPSRMAPLLAALLWAAVEIARSYGFLGFPYMTLPYSLADSALALRIASVGGVALVGLLVALANLSLYCAIRHALESWSRHGALSTALSVLARAFFSIALLLAIIGFGHAHDQVGLRDTGLRASTAPASSAPSDTIRVALIQAAASVDLPTTGGSSTGPREWAPMLQRLESLSRQALNNHPDLVAWHETAIVPPVDWYYRHRPDRDVFQFVAEVRSFLATYPAPLLLGAGYASPDDTARHTEYNSAILYSHGDAMQRYDKMKLVPFTEYFPYERYLPGLSRWIIARFGYYWTPGTQPVVFNLGAARFAAPICFEDSFGRHFASFDAPDFFVVLTNDSWARSALMQDQHLAMSRFRAAETGSTVLRVAETGSTAAIAPDGAVIAALPPFKPGILYVDVPLRKAVTTMYEAGGKYLDEVIIAMALVFALIMAFDSRRINRIDKNGSV
ncbi:MAG TPA: apolipoprotein N-acyltransferase [bacterium]|nr:apolipoprotein N-acyltransferase [bacterium]